MSSDQQSELLDLIKAQDLAGLSDFLANKFPNLPPQEQATYTGRDALKSPTSAPAQLLVAAARADSSEIFSKIWDSFCAASDSQIPYECLRQAARTGSLPLARAFVQREPRALGRTPGPVPHGRPGAGQIVTALRAGNLEYADFILAQGVPLDHEWPRVRILRVAVAWEQSDAELMAKVRWLVERGARIRGARALRRLAGYGAVEVAQVLLDAGAGVEDLEDDVPDKERAAEPVDSALMEAVKGGHPEMVKLLVTRGANSELQNAAGETPRTLAESQGHAEILRILQQAETKLI